MKLYCGDCLKILPTLAAESVDAVITDPPYGINFLSTRTNHHYAIENDADEAIDLFYAKWLPEAKRVLKPNGVLAAFAGGGAAKRMCRRATRDDENKQREKQANLNYYVVMAAMAKSDNTLLGLALIAFGLFILMRNPTMVVVAFFLMGMGLIVLMSK